MHCAESLFNQTLDDIHFFVDDASPNNFIALFILYLFR